MKVTGNVSVVGKICIRYSQRSNVTTPTAASSAGFSRKYLGNHSDCTGLPLSFLTNEALWWSALTGKVLAPVAMGDRCWLVFCFRRSLFLSSREVHHCQGLSCVRQNKSTEFWPPVKVRVWSFTSVRAKKQNILDGHGHTHTHALCLCHTPCFYFLLNGSQKGQLRPCHQYIPINKKQLFNQEIHLFRH